MWSLAGPRRSVWDRRCGSLKAASFGSQGRASKPPVADEDTRTGRYRAKLVVLQALGPGDNAIPDDRIAELVAGHAAIIAEVRARQPQARILIVADFPRGRLRREAWREIAEANAAVYAKLADNETVFYIDVGERFFRPDGSHNSAMWAGLPDPGIQTPAFEVWATRCSHGWIGLCAEEPDFAQDASSFTLRAGWPSPPMLSPRNRRAPAEPILPVPGPFSPGLAT